MFPVLLTSRVALLLVGSVILGCVASARIEHHEDLSLEGVCWLFENHEGDICCLESGITVNNDWFFDHEEPRNDGGPHFSRQYQFFSRAGIVQVGILARYFASNAKEWTRGDYDYVLPVGLLALAGDYLYVTLRMMESVAEQDKDTIDGISHANWVALSRLYVYAFRTLELGKAYAADLNRAGPAMVGDSGLLYNVYSGSVPYVGLWLAVYDLQGRIDAVMALDEPQTKADWAAYDKAWHAVYVYGAKLLATTLPFVFSSSGWKHGASQISALAAFGFLWADLSNPND